MGWPTIMMVALFTGAAGGLIGLFQISPKAGRVALALLEAFTGVDAEFFRVRPSNHPQHFVAFGINALAGRHRYTLGRQVEHPKLLHRGSAASGSTNALM